MSDLDGNPPKEGMEYIFKCWGRNPRIYGGIIVTNVKYHPKGDEYGYTYSFTDKETGEARHTNYPWALMENTPENVELIRIWEEKYNELKKFEKECSKLKSNIHTLAFKEN